MSIASRVRPEAYRSFNSHDPPPARGRQINPLQRPRNLVADNNARHAILLHEKSAQTLMPMDDFPDGALEGIECPVAPSKTPRSECYRPGSRDRAGTETTAAAAHRRAASVRCGPRVAAPSLRTARRIFLRTQKGQNCRFCAAPAPRAARPSESPAARHISANRHRVVSETPSALKADPADR